MAYINFDDLTEEKFVNGTANWSNDKKNTLLNKVTKKADEFCNSKTNHIASYFTNTLGLNLCYKFIELNYFYAYELYFLDKISVGTRTDDGIQKTENTFKYELYRDLIKKYEEEIKMEDFYNGNLTKRYNGFTTVNLYRG